MNNLSLRIYILFSTVLLWLQSHAQTDYQDIDDNLRRSRKDGSGELDGMGEMMDGVQAFHISFSDILMILLLLAACYVFGKIWKGCSYMLIGVAVIFYFLAN